MACWATTTVPRYWKAPCKQLEPAGAKHVACWAACWGISASLTLTPNRESSQLSLKSHPWLFHLCWSPPTCKQTLMSLQYSLQGRPSLNFESSYTSFLKSFTSWNWRVQDCEIKTHPWSILHHSFFTNNAWFISMFPLNLCQPSRKNTLGHHHLLEGLVFFMSKPIRMM